MTLLVVVVASLVVAGSGLPGLPYKDRQSSRVCPLPPLVAFGVSPAGEYADSWRLGLTEAGGWRYRVRW